MRLGRTHALGLVSVLTVGGLAATATNAWTAERPTAGDERSAAPGRQGAYDQAEARAAGQRKTHYTHATTLKQTCPIYENYPKAGVPLRSWQKATHAPDGRVYHLGVRYAYKGYVLVLDHAKGKDPSWGFIDRACLTDPYPRTQGDHGDRVRQDLRAVGGNGRLRDVPISAAHAGKTKRKLLHLGSNGSLRSEPASFVIGNLRGSSAGAKGDEFYITTSTCGSHNPQGWILGYAPAAGRWGYVQAGHLPACR